MAPGRVQGRLIPELQVLLLVVALSSPPSAPKWALARGFTHPGGLHRNGCTWTRNWTLWGGALYFEAKGTACSVVAILWEKTEVRIRHGTIGRGFEQVTEWYEDEGTDGQRVTAAVMGIRSRPSREFDPDVVTDLCVISLDKVFNKPVLSCVILGRWRRGSERADAIGLNDSCGLSAHHIPLDVLHALEPTVGSLSCAVNQDMGHGMRRSHMTCHHEIFHSDKRGNKLESRKPPPYGSVPPFYQRRSII
ncbi:unnamed protein product [Pleuronectes platessa]|uniref:Uncharacterized protein n=1 Tax=Pleuronectes platessa TaxID=8262 RepID=A0A9N7U7U4_PLEPL|nr:unnamed protein product [Pleuronectes platessa]